MSNKVTSDMFWDYLKVLTYNAIFNFIIGLRGGGKTYGLKKWAIEQFKKHGYQFVYLRRFKTEFDKIDKFFDDVGKEFPDDTFKVEGGKFYINDEVAGFYFALTQQMHYRSVPFDMVRLMIFDEFILDPNNQYIRYLRNEYDTLYEIIETVFRPPLRRPRVFLLGNRISDTNPYFLKFQIKTPRSKNKIFFKNHVLVQHVDLKALEEEKNKCDFYQIEAVQDYKKYSVGNEAFRDKKDFIRKAPKDMKYLFTLKNSGVEYGVYNAYRDGIWYVSENVDPTCDLVYVTRLEDHTPNTMLLKGTSKSVYIKKLVENFQQGYVYFDKANTYNIVLDAVMGSV